MVNKIKYLIIAFVVLWSLWLNIAFALIPSVDIVLSDNSSYRFDLVFTDGQTWTYRVTELQGKDLSHFVLLLETCMEHVISATPGYSLGQDGSTGYFGIKWNTDGEFRTGEFTFTLDGIYPSTDTFQILAKAGTMHNLGYITGPICNEVQATFTPTETPFFGTIPPTLTPTNTPRQIFFPTSTNTSTPTVTPTSTSTNTPIVIIIKTSTPTLVETTPPTITSTPTENGTPLPPNTPPNTPLATNTPTGVPFGETPEAEPFIGKVLLPIVGNQK